MGAAGALVARRWARAARPLGRAAAAAAVLGASAVLGGAPEARSEARAWAAAPRHGPGRASCPALRGAAPQAAPAVGPAPPGGLCGVSAAGPGAAARPAAALLGAVAMAAAARQRRRRRRGDSVPPPRGGTVRPRQPAAPKPTGPQIDGRVVDDSIGEIAQSFKVTDEDRRRRQELRKRREAEEKAAGEEEDVIKNLVAGEDPNFFGAPYIWVQIAHLLLLVYALLACVIGEAGEENTLFAFEGAQLTAFRSAVTVTLIVNFVNAAVTFWEEYSSGEDRFYPALGWGLKALVIGGVASWQRIGRIKRAEEKERKEKAKQAKLQLGKVPAS